MRIKGDSPVFATAILAVASNTEISSFVVLGAVSPLISLTGKIPRNMEERNSQVHKPSCVSFQNVGNFPTFPPIMKVSSHLIMLFPIFWTPFVITQMNFVRR